MVFLEFTNGEERKQDMERARKEDNEKGELADSFMFAFLAQSVYHREPHSHP